MPVRRGLRALVEALFLVALAVALAFAKLHAYEIVGAMLLGWLLVALLEWVTWRGEPHYGSGLPPRYYVPRVNLPPPRVVERAGLGYPAASHDDAPTWIASAAMRAEVLGEWPLVVPDGGDSPTIVESDPWLTVELPVAPLEPLAERAPAVPEERPAPAPEPPRVIVYDGPMAWHTVDPFAEPPRRRRRQPEEAPLKVEVPAYPVDPRVLPIRRDGG